MALASSSVDDPFIEAALTAAPEGIVSIDEEGMIVFATPYIEDLLGYAPEELVDEPLERFVVDDHRDRSAVESIQTQIATDGERPGEAAFDLKLAHKDGHAVSISLTATETLYEERRFVTATLREAAVEKTPEDDFDEAQTRFRKTFEYATEPLLIVDPELDSIEACNQEACELLGYTDAELHERGPSDLHPNEMDRFREFADRAFEEGDGWTDELTCHTASGDTFPAAVSAVVVTFDDRQQLLVRVQDLTEKRRRERDYHETSTLFEKIFEHSNDAILIFDPIDDEFTEVNPRACDLLGYSREKLLEMGPSDIHPHEIDTFHEFIEDVIDGGVGWTDELSCYTCDDDIVPAEISMSTVELDGRTNILASVRDIGDRKQRQKVLQEERDRLSALFDNSNDPIVEIIYQDAKPVIQAVNPAFEEVFGYDEDEVIDHTIENVLVPEDEDSKSTHDTLARQVLDGQEIEAEVERKTVTGPRDFLLRAVPFDVNGESLGTYAIYTDITDRKRHAEQLEALNVANRQLLKAETERAVADTTVDIVHEVLDQPLVAMWSYDQAETELVPLAATEPAAELDPTDEPDVSPIPAGTAEMRIFREGEPVLVEDYGALDDAAHPETPLGTLLLYPLGEHCLLNIGFRTVTDVDPTVRGLFDILAQNSRAALDRIDRERAIRRRSAAMAESTDGIGVSDDTGEFSYVNDALAKMFGYEDPAELIGTTWKRLYGSDERMRIQDDVLPTVMQRGSWRGEAIGKRADGTAFPIEMSLATLDDGGIVCVVRDITEQKAQKRQLEALNDVARELIQADDRNEITDIGVNAVERVVGCERSCIRIYDDETNQLECAAVTDEAQELLNTRAAYDMESTLAGQAFRSDDVVVNSVGVDNAGLASPFEDASFHVPIGEYGVLSVVEPEVSEFDDRDVRLSEMLAVNVRTAIERAERNQLFRNQQQELRNQRDQLETLNRINTLVQEIGESLVEATTRQELERTICSHLSESDLYQSAWIGDVEESADRIVAREGFGLEDGYLEAIDELSLSRIANGTVERAIETKEVQVVRQYQLTGDEELGNEGDRNIEATAAVPLVYGDRVRGVLVLNGIRPDVFGENQIAGFESLGRLAGFAVNAIRNRELLLSDAIVELELSITNPDTFYTRITNELDCRCQFERSVPIEGDKMSNYHKVEGAEPAAVFEIADAVDTVEDARAISEHDDGFVLQTVTSKSATQVALDAGATLQSAVAEDGEAHVTVEAPQSADVRQIVRAFDEAFSSVELIAKRERERSVQTADEFRQSVDDRLTEKQQAAIEAAYAAGYYDWPRETTAEELAESMGVSSSTLHQHLRKGIWSLLAAFFEETRVSPDAS